jgi:phosphatidylserine synthase
MEKKPPTTEVEKPEPELRIYFLPNLMMAGNLFCGFVALGKSIEAMRPGGFNEIKTALGFIMAAGTFNLLCRWPARTR